MSHLTVVRDVTKDLLVTANFLDGNIHVGRDTPTDDNELPLGLIYVRHDDARGVGAKGASPLSFEHRTQISLDIYDRAPTAGLLEVQLDNLAEQVLTLLFTNEGWLGLFDHVEGFKVEKIFPKEGDYHAGVNHIELSVAYETSWPLPDQGDDLTEINFSNDSGDGGTATTIKLPVDQ